MKKTFIVLILISLLAPMGYAQTDPADQVHKDLTELRKQMSKMRKEMSEFVKEISSEYSSDTQNAASAFSQDIKVDVTQNDKDVVVRADLPGMSKDKIEVTLSNKKMLKIAGERQTSSEVVKAGVVQQERMYGKFERVLELPAECSNEGIRASYKDGVLEVLIPKIVKPKEEVVKIKVQ